MLSRPHTVRRTFVVTLLVLGVTSACSDDASAPSAPGSMAAPITHTSDLIPSTVIARAPVVRRTQPLADSESQCADLTPKFSGGSLVLSLKKSGLKVSFYDGAVSAKTTVCLTAHPGDLLTYSFYPHGLKFNKDIKVQQDLHGTTAWKNPEVMAGMMGGYMPNDVWEDVDADGVGSFAQVFSVYYADDTGTLGKSPPTVVRFYTNHFSGYALASGRNGIATLEY